MEIVSVLSEDAVKVSTGDRALIEQWGGGMTLEGRVRSVAVLSLWVVWVGGRVLIQILVG